MFKSLHAKLLASAAGLMAVPATYAQSLTIEAESPSEYKEWAVDTKNSDGSAVSGGKGLKLDNVHKENFARYDFSVDAAGTYELKVYYITCNTRWIELSLNGGRLKLFRLDKYTPNWDGKPSGDRPGVESMSMIVKCVAGSNSLTMRGIYGPDEPYAPTVDRFELTPCDDAVVADAQEVIKVECEEPASIIGGASSEARKSFSGGKDLGFRKKYGEASYKVNVPEQGAYLMDIAFSNMQNRWVTVSVNNQKAVQNILFAENKSSQGWGDTEGQWLGHRSVIIYLEKGDNLIHLGQLNGSSPNLDCFTITRVDLSYDMSRPRVMHEASLADVAKWTLKGFGDAAPLHDHDENTVVTVDGGEDAVLLSFPQPFTISGYAVATPGDIDAVKVQISTDGNTWSDLGVNAGKSYSEGDVYTRVLSSRVKNCRYVRLNATAGSVDLGELAVYGNFSTPLDNGVIPQNHTDYVADYEGMVDFGETIKKVFDWNPAQRYTVDVLDENKSDIPVTIYLSEPVEAASYIMSIHESDNYYITRSPKTWTLEAKGSDGDFVTVDSRDNMSFVSPGSTLPLAVGDKVSSDTYRLTLKNRCKQQSHLSMFQLYADNILEDKGTPTGITAPDAAVSRVMVSGRNVCILATSASYSVYNLAGVSVASGVVNGSATFELAAGVYVIQVDGHAYKVAVD